MVVWPDRWVESSLEELKFRMRWAESSRRTRVQDEVGGHVSVQSCTMNLNECVHLTVWVFQRA